MEQTIILIIKCVRNGVVSIVLFFNRVGIFKCVLKLQMHSRIKIDVYPRSKYLKNLNREHEEVYFL